MFTLAFLPLLFYSLPQWPTPIPEQLSLVGNRAQVMFLTTQLCGDTLTFAASVVVSVNIS